MRIELQLAQQCFTREERLKNEKRASNSSAILPQKNRASTYSGILHKRIELREAQGSFSREWTLNNLIEIRFALRPKLNKTKIEVQGYHD
jgi:hypothetical protein